MTVLKRIEQDYLEAYKAKNEPVVLLLRQLKSAITAAEIANNRQELSEEDIVRILKSEVKKRKDSIVLYLQGGRQELAEKEQREISLIKNYLPEEVSEDVIREKVKKVIAETGASSVADMGKVIGAVMKEVGSAADGTTVSTIVKEELNH